MLCNEGSRVVLDIFSLQCVMIVVMKFCVLLFFRSLAMVCVLTSVQDYRTGERSAPRIYALSNVYERYELRDNKLLPAF